MRKTLMAGVFATLAGLPFTGTAQMAPGGITLMPLGTYSTNLFDAGGAEIPAYDPLTQRVFVVNLEDRAVDVLDISNPASPTKIGAIDLSVLGEAANSVAVSNGRLAVAIEAEDKQAPGVLALYDTQSLALLDSITVGALPDMVTFSPDGRYIVVANEGEPNDDYSVDPEGSVSIATYSKFFGLKVRHARFNRFNNTALRDALIASGVRIFGPNATVAQDLEPEYIAVSADSRRAWVTLQENNAVAEVDLYTARVRAIRPLGDKDLSIDGNGLDTNDKDEAIDIHTVPVHGLFLPDSIAAFQATASETVTNGHVGSDSSSQTFLITANEGDSRDYDTFSEEARVKDLDLDPVAFPDAEALQENDSIGRLQVSTVSGDIDGDGDYDALYSFGARSFTIWTSTGERIYDSGDALEQITAGVLPDFFNAGNDNNEIDNRSDNKGPEPEGLALGEIDGRTYAFIGLERIGGVMIYDISNPYAPQFVDYVNNRNFEADPEEDLAAAGDLGPEGLDFVPASESPNGQPLLIVANEISGTTTVYAVGTHVQ